MRSLEERWDGKTGVGGNRLRGEATSPPPPDCSGQRGRPRPVPGECVTPVPGPGKWCKKRRFPLRHPALPGCRAYLGRRPAPPRTLERRSRRLRSADGAEKGRPGRDLCCRRRRLPGESPARSSQSGQGPWAPEGGQRWRGEASETRRRTRAWRGAGSGACQPPDGAGMSPGITPGRAEMFFLLGDAVPRVDGWVDGRVGRLREPGFLRLSFVRQVCGGRQVWALWAGEERRGGASLGGG